VQFWEKVTALKSGYTDKKKYADCLYKYGGQNMNDPQKHALFHFCRHITYLMDLMLKDANTIQGSIESLCASLPREQDTPSGSQSQQHKM
jgi:hypothetical protein